MARPVSAIESHRQRNKIIEARAAGQTFHQIAAWADPPLSQAAICRFFQKPAAKVQAAIDSAKASIALIDNDIPESQEIATQAVTKAAMVAAADPFLSHVMRGTARRERWMSLAETRDDGPDIRGLAALDRNDITALELHAKLAGRLDAAPTSVTNTYILMPTAPAPTAPTFDTTCTETPSEE